MDESRVQAAQRLLVEPEARQTADPEVLDEDVGVLQQFAQDRHALRCLEVQAKTALVTVDREEVRSGPLAIVGRLADPGWAPAARASPPGGSTR